MLNKKSSIMTMLMYSAVLLLTLCTTTTTAQTTCFTSTNCAMGTVIADFDETTGSRSDCLDYVDNTSGSQVSQSVSNSNGECFEFGECFTPETDCTGTPTGPGAKTFLERCGVTGNANRFVPDGRSFRIFGDTVCTVIPNTANRRCYTSNDCSDGTDIAAVGDQSLNVCLGDGTSFSAHDQGLNCLVFGECFEDRTCQGAPVGTNGAKTIEPRCGEVGGVRFEPTGESFRIFDGTCNTLPGSFADPHFSMFQNNGAFDFQGECDLGLVRNPSFANNTGMDLQIRTTRFSFFSYIETAALKIGRDILEISNKALVKINGETMNFQDDEDEEETATTPTVLFAGYPVIRSTLGNKNGGKMTKVTEIKLGDSESIKFHVWDMFVGVFVKHSHNKDEESLFSGSLGMMGDFAHGRMVGRDGTTLVPDPTAFAAEWQVRNDGTDQIIFADAREPQHPQACFLPEVTERELVSDEFRMAAAVACEHFGTGGQAQKDCIYDVIATGNLDIADAEVY